MTRSRRSLNLQIRGIIMSLKDTIFDEIGFITGLKTKKTPEQLAEEARKAEAEKQKQTEEKPEDPTTILRR
jgi:hypothetical protein